MLWKSLPYFPSKRLYQPTWPSRVFENEKFPSFLPMLNINLLKIIIPIHHFHSSIKKKKSWQSSELVWEPDWRSLNSDFPTANYVLWESSFKSPCLQFLSPQWWKWSRSIVSDSSRPHGLQPTRLLCPWDSPGKSTGVGCHCLLFSQWWKYPPKAWYKPCIMWTCQALRVYGQ